MPTVEAQACHLQQSFGRSRWQEFRMDGQSKGALYKLDLQSRNEGSVERTSAVASGLHGDRNGPIVCTCLVKKERLP